MGRVASSVRQATVTIRSAAEADAEACGRIIYEAFKGVAERHAFPPDFPSAQAATGLARHFIRHPAIFGVVAERNGRIIGSNFLDERDAIRGVGPITVDPHGQRAGVGRRLMQAVLERGRKAAGIRLVQDAFNLTSHSLYASLGFEVKEPLMLMQGKPTSPPPAKMKVWPMGAEDVTACNKLCARIHGFARANELRDAIQAFKPFVALRGGRIRAYLSSATFWPLNHGVAEREEDMRALLLGAAAAMTEPLTLLVPTRRASLLRWCLSEGLRSVKPMTLMAIGAYREPRGCYFPSVAY